MDFSSIQSKLDELGRKAYDIRYSVEAETKKLQDMVWKLDALAKAAEDLKTQLSRLEGEVQDQLKGKK